MHRQSQSRIPTGPDPAANGHGRAPLHGPASYTELRTDSVVQSTNFALPPPNRSVRPHMSTPQAKQTPNPNSLKFTTTEGAFRSDGIAAYSSADEADNDRLARQLFSVSGVDDVFITPQFVTVSKDPNVDWARVKPEVEEILEEFLEA